MLQHLLVAAERYKMERLKLLCQEKLCKHIDGRTVVTMLVLADQQGWDGLKKACLTFLNSPANLRAVMANGTFDHLKRSCPSAVLELAAMNSAAQVSSTQNLLPTVVHVLQTLSCSQQCSLVMRQLCLCGCICPYGDAVIIQFFSVQLRVLQ